MITIDRCYCESKLFADLLETARRDELDLIGLARQEGCGTHCGWCVAYLRRGLRTGETAFHDLLPKETLQSAVIASYLDKLDLEENQSNDGDKP